MLRRYTIKAAHREHIEHLPAIEVAAAALFPPEDLSVEEGYSGMPVDVFFAAQKAGHLWVALVDARTPVGFAMVRIVDGSAHLYELDVHPGHGRKGIGHALVTAVCNWAELHDYPSVTLTTFVHLPFNAPFYERLGFRILAAEQCGRELAALLRAEADQGLDPVKRTAMRFRFEDR